MCQGVIPHSVSFPSSVTSAALIPINDSNDNFEQSFEMSPSELLVNLGLPIEDFYPSVAISALMRIIRDHTLSEYHAEVVGAVTYIFRALGIKSIPYIPQVIPSMIKVSERSQLGPNLLLIYVLSAAYHASDWFCSTAQLKVLLLQTFRGRSLSLSKQFYKTSIALKVMVVTY